MESKDLENQDKMSAQLTVSIILMLTNVIVLAVQALSNIIKSSLGPQGLDKMLVDDIGDVTITNDGATILKLLEVTHPAAKVLVELSQI